MVLATKSAAGFFGGACPSRMTDPCRDHPEQTELRSKLNSNNGDKRGSAHFQGSAFTASSVEPGKPDVDSPIVSAALRQKLARNSPGNNRAVNHRPEGTARTSGLSTAGVRQPRRVHEHLSKNAKKPLRV